MNDIECVNRRWSVWVAVLLSFAVIQPSRAEPSSESTLAETAGVPTGTPGKAPRCPVDPDSATYVEIPILALTGKYLNDTVRLCIAQILSLNQDSTYVSFYQRSQDRLVFESRISPYFNIDAPIRRSVWTFSFNPQVILRMSSVHSRPVRTPSYMPNIIVSRIPVVLEGDNRMWIPWARLAHHSNGEEGEPINPDGSVNVVSGNFSTNFWEAGLTSATAFRPTSIRVSNALRVPTFAFVSLSFEKHFATSIPSGTDLGDNRLNVRLRTVDPSTSVKRKVELRNQINSTWILKDPVQHNFEIMQIVRLKFMKDFGFFLRYYHGEDYYNIRFVRTTRIFSVGIIADSSGLVAFE